MKTFDINHFLMGGSHGAKDAPERPTTNNPRFINGIDNSQYLSYDRVPLKMGDKVYMLVQPSNIGVKLIEYEISGLISNNQIRVYDKEKQVTQLLPAKSVYINPIGLASLWLATIKQQIEIDLPKLQRSLEQILSNLEPKINLTSMKVGEGLDEEEI